MPANFVKFNSLGKLFLGLAIALLAVGQADAQVPPGGQFFGSVVGGVHFDANGVLSNQPVALDARLAAEIQQALGSADGDINKSTKLRMISLKALDQIVQSYAQQGEKLPVEVQYLAGIQRIEYVVASPENDDIILAGPGEGWKMNESGIVVGKTTGMPVLHLEDLIVAMNSVDNARQGSGISVSIDPTEEGVRRLNQLQRQVRSFHPDLKNAFENAMGQQKISLTGVPTDSRFSQILVAADYQMKRYSMGLTPTPVRNMPSVPEIAQRNNVRFGNRAPRFWMETNYEPVAVSTDNRVWQLRGQGVKTMTEDSVFNRQGKAIQLKGKTNKYAMSWADSMTENYENLSKADPVFRELRNVFDMSVVAAIIANENLLDKMNLSLVAIQPKSMVDLPKRNVPQSVPSQCSLVKLTRDWLIFTSGGVQIDSWSVAMNKQPVEKLGSVADVATIKTADRWWWNSDN